MDWEAVQDTTAESLPVAVKEISVGGLGSGQTISKCKIQCGRDVL